MKIVMASSGKKTLKISKSEWRNIGKKTGWLKSLGMANVNLNIENVDPSKIKIFNRGPVLTNQEIAASEARGEKPNFGDVFDIISNDLQGKMFRVYYVKADGEERGFITRREFNLYKYEPPKERKNKWPLFLDLDEASRIARETGLSKKIVTNPDGTTNAELDAEYELAKRKAQRSIMPHNIEFVLSSDGAWVVSNPVTEKGKKLLEMAQSGENPDNPDNPDNQENASIVPESEKIGSPEVVNDNVDNPDKTIEPIKTLAKTTKRTLNIRF